jgi:hypothetical protein
VLTISQWFRQLHRWLSIAFTAGVVIYMLAMTQGQPPAWLGLFALVPLILLMITGLYLFVLPHALRWRGASAEGTG